IDADDNHWCVLIDIRHGDVGYGLCGHDSADLSQGAVPGDDIVIWAEWDPNNKGTCGWSAGSVAFQMPPGGGDFVWKDNCVEQTGTTWRQCTKPVKCSEALGANPYYGGADGSGVCEGNPSRPAGTGCIEGQ
ncbi:MAG: hypothetical protein Q9218_007496, partial [Villophora microphyllina]